ncbi:hypothetical protein [Candidatus Nitrososphaera sp. FF02]|uniref:hypothetical protein n=1 Tax=Candidatus Nitrososphaera sp. FF02 TaxID=3398226 RepID=UPI0039EABD08
MENTEPDIGQSVAASERPTEIPSTALGRPYANLPSENIRSHLDSLFDTYSKLLASMHDWSMKDFFDRKIRQRILKYLFFRYSGLDHTPESKILEFDASDRRFAIKRARQFLDNLIEILEDIERCRPADVDEVVSTKKMILDFRSRIPEPPKSVNFYQIAPLVSAAVAMLLLGLNLSGPFQNLYVNIIFSFGSIGLLLFAVGLAISLAFVFRGYVWYLIMIRQFQIRRQEIALLSDLRPSTKRMSEWIYRKN